MHNFSLVNKLWHDVARLCLHARKSCTLAPGQIQYPEDAEAVSRLCASNVIPFNRISINYAGHVGQRRSAGVNFEPTFKLIDAMTLKCVNIQNFKYQLGSHIDNVSAAAEELLAHVLRSKWKTVEEISFGIIEYSHGRFAGSEEQIPAFGKVTDLVKKTQEGFSLPALHSLTFDCHQKVEGLLLSTCVLPILSIAPGLKNLNLEIPQFLLSLSTQPVLPEEKLGLLTRLTLDPETHHGWRISKSLMSTNISCKRLKLTMSEGCMRTKEMTQLLPPFLYRSQKSLVAVITDVETIQVLQKAGLLAVNIMPNMRYIFLTLDDIRYGRQQIYETFAGLRKTFPHLRSITLNKGWDCFLYPEAKLCGMFRKYSDPAGSMEGLGWWSVKRLIFQNCYNDESVEFFSILLPQLSHLGVNALQPKSEIIRILKFWPKLESLEFVENRPNRLEFEAAMCGLDQAEICELRQIPSNQLVQMAMVPTEPSIITGMPSKSTH